MIEYYVKVCSSRIGVLPVILGFADKIILLLIGSFLSYEITQVNATLFMMNYKVKRKVSEIITFAFTIVTLVA